MTSIAATLAKALPELRTSESGPDRIAYARDLWPRHHLDVSDGRIAEHRPAVIAWPRDTGEVSAIVRFCADEGVPLVPFGAGSGVSGGVLPTDRTVVIDLKRMSRWRALDEGAPTLDVEAGALGIRLEEDLEARGFTAGHFPSSILCSTVGGWLAARGAGQCSGRYGKIEDMVASIECVVGRGEVVRFHRRTHGPDLTPLIIGSEGTLGVITSATLRLHPKPETRAFGGFTFPTLEAGWTAMRDMFQAGLRPAVARLYDPFDSLIARRGSARVQDGEDEAAARASHGPKLPGAKGFALRHLVRDPALLNQAINALSDHVLQGSTLVLIFEEGASGPEDAPRGDLEHATRIARAHGATPRGEGPARHWLAHRYAVSYRQSPVFMAGAFGDTMEVAAPWSRLGELYRAVRAALGRHVFVMAHLSHAYPDGCSIYFTFAGSGATPAEAKITYDVAWRAALDAAIAAGGSLSHHHGVGRSKAPRLGAELGLGVDIVHALRGVFDPAGVMNPGNLLPRDRPARRAVPRVLADQPFGWARCDAPVPDAPVVDEASRLVHARGDLSLARIEEALTRRSLTLGIEPSVDRSITLASWIAAGAQGAADPWSDPVDHLVAGFTARLPTGADLEVRPAPRRAVGPDLFALFLGAKERVGVLTSAWLRARGSVAARAMPLALERDPAPSDLEAAWIERAFDAARSVR